MKECDRGWTFLYRRFPQSLGREAVQRALRSFLPQSNLERGSCLSSPSANPGDGQVRGPDAPATNNQTLFRVIINFLYRLVLLYLSG